MPRSRLVRWMWMALPALALPGCDGDPLPLQVAQSTDPVPIRAQLSLFDPGEEVCDGDELQLGLMATYGSIDGIKGVPLARCTDPDGFDRLVASAEINITENLSLPGCVNFFPNTFEFSQARDRVFFDAGCFDGQDFTTLVVSAQVQPNGSVSVEEVLRPGDIFEDGLELVDLRFIVNAINAVHDGEKPILVIAVKVREPGSQDEPDVAVGSCRRTLVGVWQCGTVRVLGQGDLSNYADLGFVRASLDCPPRSIAGVDPDCESPAAVTMALGLRTNFEPGTFPPPDITAIADGYLDSGPLGWVAMQGELVPGSLAQAFYQAILEGPAFGQGGGAFGAEDTLGVNYTMKWNFGDTNELRIATEGDFAQGSNVPIGLPVELSYWDGRVAFRSFDEATGDNQIIYESEDSDGADVLRAYFRPEIDLTDNITIRGASTSIRGYFHRALVNGVELGVSDRRLVATPLDTLEEIRKNLGPAYGSLAAVGAVISIDRERFEVEDSFDLGDIDPQAMTLTPAGRLYLGLGDPTDSELVELNRITHEVLRILTTDLGGFRGMAATPFGLYGTNGSQLRTVDEETGATSLIGAFTMAGTGALVDDIEGMHWVPDLQQIAALSEDGRMWDVNMLNGELNLRHRLSLPDSTKARALYAFSSRDYGAGLDDGRLVAMGLSVPLGGSGAGPALPEVSLNTLLDTGDEALTGLTVAAPEPAATALMITALVGLVLCRAGIGSQQS